MWSRNSGEADVGDLPGEQHAAGLAADAAAAYHPVAQGEKVFGVKELVYQALYLGVFGHHALEHHVRRLVAEVAAAEFELGGGEKAVVTVEILVLSVRGQIVQQAVVAADGHAAVQRPEGTAVTAHMREKNVVRIPVNCLERVDINGLVAGIDVDQHLRRIPYSGECVV